MCTQPTSLIPIIENSSNIRVLDERGRQLTTIYCCAESVQSNGLTFTAKRKGSNTIEIFWLEWTRCFTRKHYLRLRYNLIKILTK